MKRFENPRMTGIPFREGAAMVFALMALLLASLLMAGLLRTVSMSHRQLKRDEFRIQASFLADAGCARAVARLRHEPDFRSETWSVPAEQLTSDRTAVVQLTVTIDPARPNERIVSAVAEYPMGHADLVRITRKLSL